MTEDAYPIDDENDDNQLTNDQQHHDNQLTNKHHDELDLFPTDTLIAELLSRCNHGIIVLIQNAIHGPDTIQQAQSWIGNSHVCAGLAADIAQRILQQLHTKTRTIEND